MRIKDRLVLLAAGGLLTLVGCQQEPTPQPKPSSNGLDQSTLCQVDTWKPLTIANQCTPGQKILFRPGEAAGAQDAALFAAANCDLRYSTVATPGGTACIYQPIRSANALTVPDAME